MKTVYIVPHTHWDREWYETFESFRGQLVQLWDQLLALTEADPDFRFLMDGQSVVIDDYLEIRPQARARLQRAVRAGQIQVGPWYTLPDEFLVSGETLVRDLQRGLASAEAHGGSMRVGYLPDSFGHASQMPQIYRQLGFPYAAIWRGVPLSIDRVAFIWEAPDGSRVLTAYMGNSYAQGVDLPTEPVALRARIDQALKAIEPFRPTGDILLMNGNDHVLPQAALSQAVREASAHPTGAVLRLARLDDYLRRLPQDGWPRWHGELRSSARANVLMGTLSVRVPDKQRYAVASRTLERLAEPLAALSGIDASSDLERAWTLILQNAAHDTACGSGIDAVADASRRRSDQARAMARGIVERCLPRIAGDGQAWNPSPFPRQEVIELDGTAVLTPMIAGCSIANLTRVAPSMSVTTSAHRLENASLAVDLNADGTVDVLDKEREVRYQGLNRFVDEADAGDEYNFSPPLEADEALPAATEASRWEIASHSPLRGTVRLQARQTIPSSLRADRRRRTTERVLLPITVAITLDADSSRLDVDIELDNQAKDHRLRAHFPLPFSVSESIADTPFHATRRPVTAPHRDPGAPEVAMPTYPMRSFVDVSDGRAGLALITDGLHEYEMLPPPANLLALTLLRAVGWLSRDDLSTRTGHAGPAMQTPGAQVPGRHHFRYSLYFHRGDWQAGRVWRAAETALLPLQKGRGEAKPSASAPLIELDPPCVQMTMCVPSQGGFSIRVLNAADQPTDARLRARPSIRSAARVTLAGEMLDHVVARDGELQFALRPWEIATLQIRR